MQEIKIERLLPNVFKGMEESSRIRESQIWEVDSFTFKRGCKLCLQAESGGGKSSLLSFIYGNRNDYSGKILFDGRNVRTLSISDWCEIRRSHIALLPQEMRLFPELTVKENINLKNQLDLNKTPAEIEQMLEQLGVADKIDSPVVKLSIGQQQRVAIVRTLCQPFDFIFLDEPVSHLDKENNRIVASIIEKEAGKYGAGIIATSVGNHLLLDKPEFVDL
ncbi:MAG: ATP-binding cassette domain-containing protein [Muribaculaceae bacterium]|nr:ATP-binding cassette domain-containing protein [Muribaculaceae bacterium]